MDALALLKSDHDTVRGLFRNFEEAQEQDDRGRMGQLSQEIFRELELHTAIEEEIFYPRARKLAEGVDDIVKEGLEEHHVVDVLINEIKALDADDDAFVPKMTVLIENVEHHAEEEEEELFPSLREQLGDDKLEQLGKELEAAKQRGGTGSSDATRDELYEKAKEQDVSGRSSMTKEELAEAVDDD